MNLGIAVVILAAGLGTRMKSNKAKVLHEICGIPMINYVAETARKIAGNNVVLVVGNQADKVRRTVSKLGTFNFAYQKEQLGTGHAVQCALPHIPDHCREVVILCGDVPLITERALTGLAQGAADSVQAGLDRPDCCRRRPRTPCSRRWTGRTCGCPGCEAREASSFRGAWRSSTSRGRR